MCLSHCDHVYARDADTHTGLDPNLSLVHWNYWARGNGGPVGWAASRLLPPSKPHSLVTPWKSGHEVCTEVQWSRNVGHWTFPRLISSTPVQLPRKVGHQEVPHGSPDYSQDASSHRSSCSLPLAGLFRQKILLISITPACYTNFPWILLKLRFSKIHQAKKRNTH